MEALRTQDSLKVELTGERVDVTHNVYAAKLVFRLSNLASTTLGPQLIAAFIPHWAIAFLDSSKRMQIFLYQSFPLMFALSFLGYLGENWTRVHIFVGLCYGLLIVVTDLILLLFVHIPMTFVWKAALVFKTSSLPDCCNEFIKVSSTKRLEYLKSDLDTYVAGIAAQQSSVLEFMLYDQTYENRWIRGCDPIRGISILAYFAAGFIAIDYNEILPFEFGDTRMYWVLLGFGSMIATFIALKVCVVLVQLLLTIISCGILKSLIHDITMKRLVRNVNVSLGIRKLSIV